MTYAEIIERVKSILDEQTPFDSGLLVDTVEKPINVLISSCLAPAWREVVMTAPTQLLPVTSADGSNGLQFISTPADYIRFISMSCDGWARGVNLYYDPASKEALKQNYTYSAATISKPIVVADAGGFKGFPKPGSDKKLTLRYVAYITFSEDVITDIMTEYIGDPFCYNVAALVYAITNQKDLHDIMINKRDALLS